MKNERELLEILGKQAGGQQENAERIIDSSSLQEVSAIEALSGLCG